MRWLAWDLVRMVPHHADALRGLTAIWIDAGNRDEYFSTWARKPSSTRSRRSGDRRAPRDVRRRATARSTSATRCRRRSLRPEMAVRTGWGRLCGCPSP